MFVQRCRTCHHLKGRTGRIFAVNDFIRQRVEHIFIDQFPMGCRYAAHKPVGVITGTGDQGTHRAGVGIHSYRRRCKRIGSNPTAAQGSQLLVHDPFQILLQGKIYREDQAFTGKRSLSPQLADHLAPHINLFCLAAGLSPQHSIVNKLQAFFPHNTPRRKSLIFSLLKLFFRNFTHIPQHMSR